MNDVDDQWPNGDEIANLGKTPEYSPFNPELDKKYSLDGFLSDGDKELTLSGKMNPLAWASAFRSSPMGKMESEALLGNFLIAAERAGQWVDVPLVSNRQMGEEVKVGEDVSVDFSGIVFDYERGGKLLEEHGFAKKVVDDDGAEWMKPLEPMVAFIKERVGKKS